MPALPDLQEAATLLSGSVYTLQPISHLCIPKNYFVKSVHTANSFPFMYSQKIFCQISVHCIQFPIYVFQVCVHSKQFPIYVFLENILPSQCTLQTISHLCIPKKYFTKSVNTANNFPFMYSQQIFCQFSVHCKHFPIYVFPKKILPSQCTLQTISHLCFPKKIFCQVSALHTANSFPFMYSQKIFYQVSVHCKHFPIYVFPKNILSSQ
jgi:hypothetical protein